MGGFARTQFKDPIKTELDRVYCVTSHETHGSLNCVRAKPPLRVVLKIKLLGKGLTQEISGYPDILLMGSCPLISRSTTPPVLVLGTAL